MSLKDININNIQVSDNFKLYEFECKCCRAVKIHKPLLNGLQSLRRSVAEPFSPNSAFRCINHNFIVGGKSRSYHLRGMAVDLGIYMSREDWRIDLLRRYGFTGILYYPLQQFWHLDVREGKSVINLDYRPKPLATGVSK